MTTRPSKFVEWNPTGSNITEPLTALKAAGYTKDDIPTGVNHNWIFYMLDQWIQYLDERLEKADLVITSTSDFETEINALDHDSLVYISESITLSALATISKRVKFRFASDAFIILDGAITSGIIFGARPHFENLNLEIQENMTNALRMSCDGFRIDSGLWRMNGSGKTLTNTVLIDAGMKGVVVGTAVEDDGTITNRSGPTCDPDMNSVILIP